MRYVVSIAVALLIAVGLAAWIGPPKEDLGMVAQFENCVSVMAVEWNYDRITGPEKTNMAEAINTACGWYELSFGEREIVLENIKKS